MHALLKTGAARPLRCVQTHPHSVAPLTSTHRSQESPPPGGRGKTRELRQTALPVHSSVPNLALSSPPSSALQFETIAPQPLGMIDHPEVAGPCDDMPLPGMSLAWRRSRPSRGRRKLPRESVIARSKGYFSPTGGSPYRNISASTGSRLCLKPATNYIRSHNRGADLSGHVVILYCT